MKLVNETNWDTSQFKAFIRAVAEKEALTPEDISKLDVTIKYRRRSRRWEDNAVKGWGWYNSWRMRLEVVQGVALDKVQAARQIALMLTFNQGVRKSTIRHDGGFYGTGWQERWAWANELPLEMNPEVPVAKPGKSIRVLSQIEHCLRQIVDWEKREKLAKTKLKTWNSKLKYYERRSRELAGGGKMEPVVPGPEKVRADEQTAGWVDVIRRGK
jgi:hypothetical protein